MSGGHSSYTYGMKLFHLTNAVIITNYYDVINNYEAQEKNAIIKTNWHATHLTNCYRQIALLSQRGRAMRRVCQ